MDDRTTDLTPRFTAPYRGAVKRRQFLATTTLAALPNLEAAAAASAFQAQARAPAPAATPFPLNRVHLRPGIVYDQQQINRRFLLAQDPDRLLHTFRLNAGLPSTAEPIGGWEAPVNELRGHYTGHYLSACALFAAQGDAELKARGDLMVTELARCQDALGTGYLSAFPEEFFDRLRDGRPVWAPFYTIHKIMAGLLDMHQLAGNEPALAMLRRKATWVSRWTQPIGDAHMARILEREYGGMNEVLYNLAAITTQGRRGIMDGARKFDHERVFGPLAAGRDELKGFHANTLIPKIIGAARRYELTGEARYRAVAEYFWREVTTHRAYCTGGTSNGEGWDNEPDMLAAELSGYTQEDCVTYNMMKLTRQVFGWSADPACADYYERALWNGIMGVQHPEDGNKLYYVPLQSGFWKMFGTPTQDYWCCTGSMSEAFAKLADSIYFQDGDGLWVNLFIASELDWSEKGVRIEQATRFPEEAGTTLTIRTRQPVPLALRIRVPYWTGRGAGARLNGRALDGFAAPGGYFVVDRTWRDGDTLAVSLPMRLHVAPTPDDPAMQAVMYGPLVLVGRLGTEGLTPATLRAVPTPPRQIPTYQAQPVAPPAFRAPSADPSSWIQPVAGKPLEFVTTGQERNVTLVPFYQLFDERYGVYWRVSRA